MDNIATDYEDTISGMFGTLDYLQEAYNKHKEDAEWYLESYDSLWKLGTLSREISKAIDDTDSIRIRQRYRDLQAEINKLQQEGTQLTEHQVEMLQHEFELEQARAALEEAKNAKTQVRLQRDSEGRWGYVYTANNDAIDDAMNKYAEALHAFQETNHNEFKKLQDDFMELLNFGTDIVEIMSDMDVSADEAEAIVRDRMDLILGDDGQLQRLLDELT
jgi:nitrous oxide reductase